MRARGCSGVPLRAGALLLVLACVVAATGVRRAAAGISFVVTNTADSGQGSLRQALLTANQVPGTDTITFNVSGKGPRVISPLSPLPTITDPVVIDGFTQPGSFANESRQGLDAGILIVLNGAALGQQLPFTDGLLTVTAGGSTIRGLVINGSPAHGIVLRGGGANVVAGNYIGTDRGGGMSVLNQGSGVLIDDSPSNRIGGTLAADRNLISGNDGSGVDIEGTPSSGNVVQGNLIGLIAAGDAALPNDGDGIDLIDAPNNLIGGTDPNARNVISGNDNDAIFIDDPGADNNIIQGNFLGTDVTGTSAIPNDNDAIFITQGADNNLIGGTDPNARNIISGNNGYAVSFSLFSGTDVVGNVVQGNFMGTDVTGTAAVPNIDGGVSFFDTVGNNVVGGIEPGAGNVISGNLGNGVDFAARTAVTGTVQGNRIGTNAAGTAALPNAGSGIAVFDPGDILIGGGVPNVISGNGIHGVEISFSATTPNAVRIQSNLIGTDASGTAAVPNVMDGIQISGAAGNVIEANVIGFNGGNGITVAFDSAVNNRITGNSIFANTGGFFPDQKLLRRSRGARPFGGNGGPGGVTVPGLGIDLTPSLNPPDGVTPNDPLDADTGPNNLQNFPVVTSADFSMAKGLVGVLLNSTPNTTFRVEVFADDTPEPLGHGEGRHFLGGGDVLTDAKGTAAVTLVVSFPPTSATAVTATATDPNGNTSEFGPRFVLGGPTDTQPPVISKCQVTPRSLPSAGGAVLITATVTDNVGVQSVTATVTRPDESTATVTLARQKQGNTFSGSFSAPANTGTSPETYGVTVTARDAAGNQTNSDCGTFTVAPPGAGRLQVSPRRLSFSSTRIGLGRTGRVVIRNTGKGTLTGTVGTISGPFFVRSGGGSFSLEPGESREVTVLFAPSDRGRFSGSLPISSSDPDRPNIVFPLAGEGCGNRPRK